MATVSDNLSCYHEAGHAVVSLLLGQLPETVSIRADDESSGRMEYLPIEARQITKSAMFGRTAEDRQRVMQFLVANAAGPAAQAMHMRKGSRANLDNKTSWETFAGGGDYDRAISVMNSAKRLLHVSLEDIADEAFDLLEQPDIWAAVTHVAEDLRRFGELDYQGIFDAVHNRDAIKTQSIADRIGS
jgi:hypothetical protein